MDLNGKELTREDFIEILRKFEDTDTINIPKEIPKNARFLTSRELDALEWARKFMNDYERKHK